MPSKTSHNTLIEVVWTVLPILILVGIAVPSFSLLLAQHDPARAVPSYDPEKAITIKATGSQWFWTYTYPDHGDLEFNSLMLTEAEITDPAKEPRLLAVDNQMVVPDRHRRPHAGDRRRRDPRLHRARRSASRSTRFPAG